jgi:hypothetical protein
LGLLSGESADGVADPSEGALGGADVEAGVDRRHGPGHSLLDHPLDELVQGDGDVGDGLARERAYQRGEVATGQCRWTGHVQRPAPRFGADQGRGGGACAVLAGDVGDGAAASGVHQLAGGDGARERPEEQIGVQVVAQYGEIEPGVGEGGLGLRVIRRDGDG